MFHRQAVLTKVNKQQMFNKPKKDLNRNVAIYLLVDPDTGLANKNWIDFFKKGNGILGFGYSTYSAFRKMDFWNLYSFIYDLMDLYAEQQSHFIKEHKLTAKQFELHKQCIAKNDQVYLEKNKSINKKIKIISIVSENDNLTLDHNQVNKLTHAQTNQLKNLLTSLLEQL